MSMSQFASPDSTIAENLAQIGRKTESTWRVRGVTAITSSGVQVDVGGGTSVDVPCLSSYVGRAVGDKVLMVVTDVGWCVLGRIGSADNLPLTFSAPVPPEEFIGLPPPVTVVPPEESFDA